MKEKKKDKDIGMKKDSCDDATCPVHGSLKVRGRTFKGIVTRKFPRRIAIEFERTVYVRKYERFTKKKTRIHARLPKCCEDKVNVGDYVLVGECRPLSKIIHFVFLNKVNEEQKK